MSHNPSEIVLIWFQYTFYVEIRNIFTLTSDEFDASFLNWKINSLKNKNKRYWPLIFERKCTHVKKFLWLSLLNRIEKHLAQKCQEVARVKTSGFSFRNTCSFLTSDITFCLWPPSLPQCWRVCPSQPARPNGALASSAIPTSSMSPSASPPNPPQKNCP